MTYKNVLHELCYQVVVFCRKISIEERDFLRIVFMLHRVACPVVRLKFNTIFHSKELKQTLKDNTNKLIQLKVEKRITPSQWDLLFPTNGRYFPI